MRRTISYISAIVAAMGIGVLAGTGGGALNAQPGQAMSLGAHHQHITLTLQPGEGETIPYPETSNVVTFTVGAAGKGFFVGTTMLDPATGQPPGLGRDGVGVLFENTGPHYVVADDDDPENCFDCGSFLLNLSTEPITFDITFWY